MNDTLIILVIIIAISLIYIGIRTDKKNRREVKDNAILENKDKIQTLINNVIESKDGKKKLRLMSMIYNNHLSQDKNLLKGFEYQLKLSIPELFKINFLERLIFILLDVISFIVLCLLLTPIDLLTRQEAIEPEWIYINIGLIIVWIFFRRKSLSILYPIRYNFTVRRFNADRFTNLEINKIKKA